MPLTPEDKVREHAERLHQAIFKKALHGRLVTQDLDDEHVDVLNKIHRLEGRQKRF